MNTFTIIIAIIAILIILCSAIYVLLKDRAKLRRENKRLENDLKSAKVNIEQLSGYIDKMRKIKADEKTLTEKIKEAKSDEEVYNIIADIVADNNNRVQND